MRSFIRCDNRCHVALFVVSVWIVAYIPTVHADEAVRKQFLQTYESSLSDYNSYYQGKRIVGVLRRISKVDQQTMSEEKLSMWNFGSCGRLDITQIFDADPQSKAQDFSHICNSQYAASVRGNVLNGYAITKFSGLAQAEGILKQMNFDSDALRGGYYWENGLVSDFLKWERLDCKEISSATWANEACLVLKIDLLSATGERARWYELYYQVREESPRCRLLGYRYSGSKASKGVEIIETTHWYDADKCVYIPSFSRTRRYNSESNLNVNSGTEFILESISSDQPANIFFTLTAFDLPEPFGVTWPKPTPRYVYILGAASLFAIVGLLLRWFLRRHGRRSSTNTSSTPTGVGEP